MLDVPGDGPFIQKPILKNRYKFDHVARRSTVWRYVAACWVSRVRAGGVGWRSANRAALSALNGGAPANRTLSTPRDRLQGIGLRHFAWKRLDRPCKWREGVGDTHTTGARGEWWDARALRRLYALNANLFRGKRGGKKSQGSSFSNSTSAFKILFEKFLILFLCARGLCWTSSVPREEKKSMNKYIKMKKLIRSRFSTSLPNVFRKIKLNRFWE